MNKLNLPPFYIGQKVIYITGNNMPKDSIHTIINIIKMHCGCFCIDIGKQCNVLTKTYCINHASKIGPFLPSSKIQWFNSNSFRPFQQQSFPLIKLSKIQELEKEEILIEN